MTTPENYYTKDELEYLQNRLSDTETNLKFQEQGHVSFPRGEAALILTLENCLKIALKTRYPSIPEDTEKTGDSECTEMDGCPTEGAVLKREWRAMRLAIKRERAELDDELVHDFLGKVNKESIRARIVALDAVIGGDMKTNRFSDGTKIFPNRE